MSMTSDVRKRLYELLHAAKFRPERCCVELMGTRTYTWFVDDADRYVELRDSVNSSDFSVITRDGKIIGGVIVSTPEEAVARSMECVERLSGSR